MSIQKITQTEIERASMSGVSNRPSDSTGFGGARMSAADLKERFSALALLSIEKVNELIDLIIVKEGEESALLELLMVSNDEALSEFVFRINTEMKEKLSFGEAQELLEEIVTAGKNAVGNVDDAKETALSKIEAEVTAAESAVAKAKEYAASAESAATEAADACLSELMETYEADMGDISAALDAIIEMQEGLIGGESA